MKYIMKLIIISTICILTSRVESQSFFKLDQNRYNDGQSRTDGRIVFTPVTEAPSVGPSENYQFGTIKQAEQKQRELTEFDSYLQAISRSHNYPDQKSTNNNTGDKRIQFEEPNLELSPPPYGPNSSHDYYSAQRKDLEQLANKTKDSITPEDKFSKEQMNIDNKQGNQIDNTILSNVTVALSRFGLNLLKSASVFQSGNIIVSPVSIATVLALLQQGATGESLDQITRALQMTPDTTEAAYGTITANMRKRNSRNHLAIANNILVADAFELNNAFKTVAVRSFWSEVTPTSFSNPSFAIQRINAWVASNTNNKIKDLLQPGSLSPNTQLALVNAVYFKGIWETKFKPERTKPGEFKLPNGAKKMVPFMHTRHSFKVGIDPANRALVTILPFESRQYSLMLILPSKSDNADNLLKSLTVDQLLYYHSFYSVEIKVEIPKFTLKSDTDLSPVLKDLGITNIFGSKSDLSGIGLYRTFSPQISNAVHSGYFSIDEQGVTAAAATSIAAVALSFDDSTTTFRADRPFIAALWDQQFSIPLFIAKIEDPS